jgi:enamine deaminase RidA (YjgF/YER057c/UK114 family)
MKRMGFTHWEPGKMSIVRHGVTRRYADSVVHGGTAYLVEVPPDLEANITDQTRALLTSAERLLAQAGSDRSHLLMVTIYLADMADYAAMNAVWDEWLPAGCAPARACVEARLADPRMRVEMAFTAAVVQD